ncbi:MAG: MFS transporter [Clostridia bacterium]|nr:MFS transporter [Clostridia bacterium]
MQATPSVQPKKRFFYGWIIVLSCALIYAASVGIFLNCLGIFVKPVTTDLGFERGPFTLYATISGTVGMMSQLIYGELYRRYPKKIRMFIGIAVIVCPSAFIGYSMATKLWHFYAFAAMYGSCSTVLAAISITTLINNWFLERRGLATGIAFAGSGVSAAIMTPVLTAIVEDYGWRVGYRTMAAVAFVIMAVALSLIKVTPEEKGELPYGMKPRATDPDLPQNTVTVAPRIEAKGITRAQALKEPAYFIQIAGMLCLGIAGMGMSGHIIAYLTDIGYSDSTAAAAMSLVMTIMIGAKILLGALFDKIGPVPSAFLSGVCMFFSVVTLRFAGMAPFMPYVFALCFGFGYSTLSVPYSYLIAQNFGTREFATVYSLAVTISGLGNSFAPSISGVLYDAFGSYYGVWNIYIGSTIAATCLLTLAAIISKKKDFKNR